MTRDICGLNQWCTDCSYLFSKGRGGCWYVLWVAANGFHGDSTFVYIYILDIRNIYIYILDIRNIYIYILDIRNIYIYIFIYSISWNSQSTKSSNNEEPLVLKYGWSFPHFLRWCSQPGVYLAEELATWEDLNPDTLGSKALGLQEIILPNICVYIYIIPFH